MPISSRNQYLMPPLDARPDDKLGFLTETMEDAEAFLKAQRSWSDIDKAVDIISGSTDLKIPRGMSAISANVLKRDIRENTATLSNMRPMWSYKTDNDDYQRQAQVLNKMLQAWYLGSFADRSIRTALQYAGACGLGYISPSWVNDFIISGRGDIALLWYGPRDIKPYGLPRDKNLQKAYSVTIADEMPVQQAMIEFPNHLDLLAPDKGTPSWMKKGVRRVQRFLSPLLNAFGPGSGKETSDSPFPTVTVYRTYTMDQTLNMTDKEIVMGAGTNWQYKVPVFDSLIETGNKDEQGRPTYRKATREDCMLFPLRRLTKWTKAGIMYDGTATNWHGRVPVIPIVLDEWPWDFFGYTMTRDGSSIQDAASRVLRALDDSANVKLDSPLAYDETSISQGLMDRINPRKAGQRVKINMQQNEMPIKPVIPAEYYSVDTWVSTWPEKLYELMHYLLGTRDIQAIAKAKQVPSGDSMEKLMELAGPIVTDMSRGMERAMVEVGEQWKGLAFQYLDLKRRVQVLGKDGVTEEDYDYDPGNMIPSHLPDELERIKRKELPENYESRADIVQRARAHLNSFYFHLTPYSMHQITQLTKKMLFLQLWKGQFPIDPWTMAEVMDIPNFGSPYALHKILDRPKSDIPDDVFGKWIMWMEVRTKLAPQPQQKGRHPSGQTPPAMQGKDGGTRQTVRESAR